MDELAAIWSIYAASDINKIPICLMKKKKIAAAALVLAGLAASGQPSQKAIFTSTNFSIFPDLVTWKNERAFIKGDTLFSTFKGNDEPLYSSTVEAYKRSIVLKNKAYPILRSSVPMVDALYNMTLNELDLLRTSDGYFDTGKSWGGVWTRDLSYATILGIAIADPDVAKKGLMRKTKDGHIIQDTGSGGSWPISSDRMTWVLAAWEIYKYTGDESWLKTIYPIVKNSVEADLKTIYYPNSLPTGESSFLDWREQTYPQWMMPVDIYRSENLGTAVVHYQTYNILGMIEGAMGVKSSKYARLAEKVKARINQKLWMNDKGYYAQYLYGKHYLSLSPRAEALGEALAVIYDVADSHRARTVVESTPITEYGITCIYPQIPEVGPYHNNSVWPFVQAFWNLAAAKVKNEKALEYGMASIYRAASMYLTNKENFVASTGDCHGTAINSDRQLWSVGANIGMTYKIIFGMNFEPKGIVFSPSIPQAYAGSYTLTNFKYRKATVNITISGFGDEVASFKVNGVAQNPMLDGNVAGVQNVEIVMKNKPFGSSKVNLQPVAYSPATPKLQLQGSILQWEANDAAREFVVYRNGAKVGTTKHSSFEIKPIDTYSEYQVMAVDKNGMQSFLSNPIQVFPADKTYVVEVENFNRKSELPYTSYDGSGFVESSKKVNPAISFPVDVEADGQYLVSIRYSNGTDRMCCGNSAALRTLSVNGKRQGTMVFPIVEQDAWSDWRPSNLLVVTLKKGVNTIQLSLEKHNENMNGQVNMLMVDSFKAVKL